MIPSLLQANGRRRSWYRTLHRWVGVASAVFVLLLALTGVALNHSHSWGLDQRHVGWSWVLDLYGIETPAPAASFTDGTHRATLLGRQVYFDDHPLSSDIAALNGLVMLQDFALAGTDRDVLLITPAGELVERIDLATQLPGPIERMGSWRGRAVIAADGTLFISDRQVTRFEPARDMDERSIEWSRPTPPPAALLQALDEDYRGRGLTIERLLTEIHSGRIIGKAGPLLMDLAAVCLIVLSLSGLVLWTRRSRRNRRR